MRIEILTAGPYSKFKPGKISAEMLKAGDVVDLPDWYALDLIKSELAKVVEGVVVGEVLFKEDLSDKATLIEQIDRQLPKKRGRKRKNA